MEEEIIAYQDQGEETPSNQGGAAWPPWVSLTLARGEEVIARMESTTASSWLPAT
jgi:hypothetical protein